MSQERITRDIPEDDIIEVSDDAIPSPESDTTTEESETAEDPNPTMASEGAMVVEEPTERHESLSQGDESHVAQGEENELDDLVSTLLEETQAVPNPQTGEASAPAFADAPVEEPDEEDVWDDGSITPYVGIYGSGDEGNVLVPMSHETTVISDTPSGGSWQRSPEPKRRRHDPKAPEDGKYKVSVGSMVACLLVGLAIGVLVTFIVTSEVGKGSQTAEDDGKALVSGTVGTDSLDTEMVRYSYGEDEVSLSVRDVITLTGSLDSMRDEATKRYSVPSAEKALEAVRNDIVQKDAERHGIRVTDGDVLEYVSDTYGVATVDELAQQVELSNEETERQLRERLIIKFLKEDVVGDKHLLPLVEPPLPDDGDPEVLTEIYATYIVNLAGDEWDMAGNRWKSDESAFAKALADTPFEGGLASYDMARKAYDVVHQRNEEIQRTIDGAWSDYINNMFRQTTVTLSVASR